MSFIGQKDLMLEIPAGKMIDGNGTWLSINKFGRNNLSADGIAADLWLSGGTYPFTATTTGGAANITHIKQLTDVVANRGGLIEVQGLDINWNLVTQTIHLDATNSTTLTAFTTPMRRIFRATSQQAVTLGAQVNIVSSAATSLFAVIAAGANQTQMAIYTVPSGYTAYMTNYYGAFVPTATPPKNPDSCTFSLHTADNTNTYFERLRHEAGTAQGAASFQHFFAPYYKFDQLSDIIMHTVCIGDPGVVNGGFDLVLVPN